MHPASSPVGGVIFSDGDVAYRRSVLTQMAVHMAPTSNVTDALFYRGIGFSHSQCHGYTRSHRHDGMSHERGSNLGE